MSDATPPPPPPAPLARRERARPAGGRAATPARAPAGGTPAADASSPRPTYLALVGEGAGSEVPLDGRLARSTRTRRAITDALLDLIDEGDLNPTARRIAVRAGVSERSVFQHFEDLEELLRAAAEREFERVLAMMTEIDRSLDVPERVAAFVAQRARVVEAVTPVRRAASLREPFSPEVRRGFDRFLVAGMEEVRHVFANELRAHDRRRRTVLAVAIDMAASWNAWDHLRAQGLSVQSAAEVMEATVLALLGGRARRGSASKGR